MFDPAWPDVPSQAPATGTIYQVETYQGLTTDQRARRVGDVLIIRLEERTQAKKSASSSAARNSQTSLDLPNAAPFKTVNEALFAGGATSSFTGSGRAAQENQLSGSVGVVVVRMLPNGVLMVRGQKRVRLNRGEEHIQFSGLVRSVDVDGDNSVSSRQVADAKISYAGRGEIADQSRQGWMQRFFTKISAF
jgi:flagellar L-ring protein FlgH